MKYLYACEPGNHAITAFRPMDARDEPVYCLEHGAVCGRDFAAEVGSQYLPPKLDRNQWTLWSEVHDRSPKELARDRNVSRYDPAMSHKPAYAPPTASELARLADSVPRHQMDNGIPD